MTAVHVNIQNGQHQNLKQQIYPWTIQQTGDIETYRPGVECQQVGVFHQGTTPFHEIGTYLGDGQRFITRFCILSADFQIFFEKCLKTWGAFLLTLAILRVVKIEQTGKPLMFRQ